MAQRKHPPKALIAVVLLALLGAGGWWWWSSTRAAEPGAPATYSGSVDTTSYQVAAAMAGRVTAVEVREGSRVRSGQVLLRLDAAALKLQLEQARAGVRAARAALTNARDDQDSTKADIAAAKARLSQAEAAVELAKVQLGYAVVTAPRDGIVVSVTTNTGQNAAPGRTLLTLVDPAELFVRVFLPEPRMGEVAVGQAARLRTDAGQTFDGTVSFIASEAEFTPNNVQTAEQRVKLVYQVRIRTTDPSGSLKAGMPVDVTFG